MLKKAPAEYYFESEGCYITELSNSPEDPALSIAKARVQPGVSTAWHCLKGTTERYCILAGSGLAEIGREPGCVVSVGDVLTIPPGVRQRITNTGAEDLIFLALCTPRFLLDNYQALSAD